MLVSRSVSRLSWSRSKFLTPQRMVLLSTVWVWSFGQGHAPFSWSDE